MSSQTLPASDRIRRRPDFRRIYDTGARANSSFMTVFALANGRGSARFGVAATRRIGSAVDRNRAKRLAREIFRRHKEVAGIDVVVVPRREMLDAPFANLEADYLAALRRCEDGSRRSRQRPGSRTPKSV